MTRYEYKVIDTGEHVEEQLDELGVQGWQVVGVTTKRAVCSSPRPQAIVVIADDAASRRRSSDRCAGALRGPEQVAK